MGKQLQSWWKIEAIKGMMGGYWQMLPPLFQGGRSMAQALSSAQEAEAQRIYRILQTSCEQDLLGLARLLASKPDRELLGKTEFEVRDRVHQIGAKAIETALEERKKGGTKGRA
jgi:hypothetical protein